MDVLLSIRRTANDLRVQNPHHFEEVLRSVREDPSVGVETYFSFPFDYITHNERFTLLQDVIRICVHVTLKMHMKSDNHDSFDDFDD